MTVDEVVKLTPVALNLIMLKLCGWEYGVGGCDYWSQFEDGHYRTSEKEERGMPDYPNDLNMMADAVDQMIRQHGTKFMVMFNNKLGDMFCHHDHLDDEMIHASALKRARAFIMAHGDL